jgi:Tol biopolymer transport system component
MLGDMIGSIVLAAVASLAAPTPFAPDMLAGPGSVSSPAFAPDGKTVVFDISDHGSTLYISHRVGGAWTAPVVAPFSGGTYLDHDATMAPDGSYLVFVSNRPAATGGPIVTVTHNGKVSPWGGNLWRVDRHGESWGVPVRLPDAVNGSVQTYAPSIAADGSIYFIHPDEAGAFHIYRSTYRDGAYLPAERLNIGAANAHEMDPAIAPAQSFIVFDAPDPKHPDSDILFVAHRTATGWTTPIALDAINGDDQPWGAHLGPDGRLYFSSSRGRTDNVAKLWSAPLPF